MTLLPLGRARPFSQSPLSPFSVSVPFVASPCVYDVHMCVSLQWIPFVLDSVCAVSFQRCLADSQSGDNSLLPLPPYHSPHTRTPARREKIRPFCFLNLRCFGLGSQENLITDNVTGMWDAGSCLDSYSMQFPGSSVQQLRLSLRKL